MRVLKKIGVSFLFILVTMFFVSKNVLADEQYKEVVDNEGLKSAIENGENIRLNADLEISETIKISNKNIILDLNGFKIIGMDEKTSGNFNLFEILKGEFTIIDSKGTGSISLVAETNRGWGGMSTLIENRGGIVNIKGGDIKHLGGSDMAFVVNVNANSFGNTTLNVSNGKLYSTYTAIRLFMSSTALATLNIDGGNIDGITSAIWAQAPESKIGQTGDINISNGNIGTINTARSEKSSISTKITGGNVTNIKSESGELKISGGHISGTLTILDANSETVEQDEIINGGTFENNPENYLSKEVTANAIITTIDKTFYAIGKETVQYVVSNLKSGSTAFISGNIELTNIQNGVMIKADENSNVTANGTFVSQDGILIEEIKPSIDKAEVIVCPNDDKINIQTCIDEGNSEEVCIKMLCPNTEVIENPKTGNYLPIFGILMISIVTSLIFISTSGENYFTKLK